MGFSITFNNPLNKVGRNYIQWYKIMLIVIANFCYTQRYPCRMFGDFNKYFCAQ